MKHSLQLKLSQHLTLTPQLQQSIRLLQLSTLDLNQEIENFLVENPLLERVDPNYEAPLAMPLSGPNQETPSNAKESEATTEIYTQFHTLSLHDALPICIVYSSSFHSI